MFYRIAKRLLDITIALTGLILIAPVMFIIALIIKLQDGGPVFADLPLRVGKGGKLFFMYKFRSMIPNAHNMIQKDPKYKELKEKWIKQDKLAVNEDPRITPIGKIIRKTDIDETAQFFNVLKGDMSFVGPRACFDHEMEHYKKLYPEVVKLAPIVTSVKPGITGLWQTSGRNDISIIGRFELDAKYAQQQSILFDIYLILLHYLRKVLES
jgi:lipopolysaccharide/colanic/teichoic acid biosynthesis glycosyltransferase